MDREHLLALRDALSGEANLNWNAGTPTAAWDGVAVDGPPPRAILAANTVALVNVLTDPKGRRSGAAYLGVGVDFAKVLHRTTIRWAKQP